MEDTLTHHEYLADKAKLDHYRAAICRVIRPHHVVLDLGCGTGILGLMALQAGAARVHFLDNGPVVDVARQTVEESRFAGRGSYYQASSFEVELPERVDVVVCDHVGYFGFDYGILDLLADAKERFLKPGGIVVPAQIELLLAPVSSDECRKIVAKWRDGSIPEEFAWIGATAANTKHGVMLKSDDMLAPPKSLGSLALGDSAPPYLSWEATYNCERAGLLDGVAGFFDCRLHSDVHMTNSPLEVGALSRPQAFLPLEESVEIDVGDILRATVMVRPQDNVIGWVVELPDSGKRFAQTTFNGIELDKESMTRTNPNRIARLNQRGKARQIVLSYCDGSRTVSEIQALVEKEHPELLPSRHATQTFVRSVLEWDTSG